MNHGSSRAIHGIHILGSDNCLTCLLHNGTYNIFRQFIDDELEIVRAAMSSKLLFSLLCDEILEIHSLYLAVREYEQHQFEIEVENEALEAICEDMQRERYPYLYDEIE